MCQHINVLLFLENVWFSLIIIKPLAERVMCPLNNWAPTNRGLAIKYKQRQDFCHENSLLGWYTWIIACFTIFLCFNNHCLCFLMAGAHHEQDQKGVYSESRLWSTKGPHSILCSGRFVQVGASHGDIRQSRQGIFTSLSFHQLLARCWFSSLLEEKLKLTNSIKLWVCNLWHLLFPGCSA